MEKLLNKRNTVIVISLLTLWRLFLSAELQLHPDEAYYWLWSRYPDIGYFDHAPMVAYFIWLTTLVSTSELWVRLSGTLVSLALSALIWQLAMQLFRNVQVAAGSVVLFSVYPLTMLGLTVITPDTPVLLFWSLGIYLFWQIIRTNTAWLWYVLGLSFGLALLSKYTAILMIPCIFIYLVLTDDRRWLKTRYPYLAVLIGLACFLPVVYWNGQQDWLSFRFQFKHGLGGNEYAFAKVAEYIGGQLLITGPVVWLLGMYAAGVGLFRRDKATLFLVSASLPVIVFFGLTSFKNAAGPNWPAFAYFSFSILVSKYCLDGSSTLRRSLWALAVVSSLVISATVTLHARFNLLPLERHSKELAAADATNYFHGWRELGAELMKDPTVDFAVTPSHQLSAEIIYYTNSKVLAQTARTTRPSQFNLWSATQDIPGRDGLNVWTDGDSMGPQGDYFSSPAMSRSLKVYRDGRTLRTYYMWAGPKNVAPPFTSN